MLNLIKLLTSRVNNFQDLQGIINSPKDLSFWMHHNIVYKKDQDKFGKKERWQTPDEFLSKQNQFRKRTGDCEDYANLAYHALEKLYPKRQIVAALPPMGEGHSVMVYQDPKDGQTYYTDLAKIKKVPREVTTKFKFAKLVRPDAETFRIYSPEGKTIRSLYTGVHDDEDLFV